MVSLNNLLITSISFGDILNILSMILVKNSLLFLLAYIGTKILRNVSASTRHLIWTITFLFALLLPVLHLVMPKWYLKTELIQLFQSKPDKMNSNQIFENKTSVSENRSQDNLIVPLDKNAKTDDTEIINLHEGAIIKVQKEQRSRENTVWDRINGFYILLLLSAIWIIGTFFFLFRYLLGHLILKHRFGAAEEVRDFSWICFIKRLKKELNINRSIQLFRWERSSVPLTWGIIWPKILLPEDTKNWNSTQKQYVLLHELAHIKRLDNLTQAIMQLVVAFNWFNPIVWLASRQFTKERELACDEYVVLKGNKASDYADFLLNIARKITQKPTLSFGTVSMAHHKELEGRLLAILNYKNGDSDKKRVLIVSFLFFFLISVISLNTESLGQPESSDLQNDPDTNISKASGVEKLYSENITPKEIQKSSKLQEQEIISVLEKSLSDSSENVRLEAIKTLGKIKSPASVTVLLKALKDPDKNIREKIIDVLATQSDTRIIPALIESLNDKNEDVREEAINALEKLKEQRAVEPIIGLLRDKHSSVREEAAEALGNLANPVAMESLRATLSDENWEVRSEVIEALGKLHDYQAVPLLGEALEEKRWRIREKASRALGNIGGEKAFNYLINHRKDKQEEVRQEIVRAFGKIKLADAVIPLYEALFDTESDVREEAANSLLEINTKDSWDFLEKGMKSESFKVKDDILEALEDYPSEKAIELIKVALDDLEWRVRREALETLAYFPKDLAFPLLNEALNDKNQSVREEAAETLGKIFEE
jgi:HEAT repeat protein/beta-lactamase regulating signal transducer with metallopeptidase domain